MAEDLKDILSHLNKAVSQETLLKYLNHQLDPEQTHQVEQHLLEDDFENDAVEGLQTISDTDRMNLIVDKLNRDLKKRTQRKKKALTKRNLQPQWWLYWSVLILLIILSLIYMYLRSRIT